MLKIIKNYQKNIEKDPVEMVERKGIGHPDTLSDMIAENFSNNYSNYCLNEFGTILNHWTDKVLLSGGTAELDFGSTNIIRPIKAYLFGRVTEKIGNQKIDIDYLFKKSVEEVFSKIFTGQNILNHIDYVVDTNQAIGKDHPKEFYFPKSADEVRKCWDALKSNDTVICSGNAPYSPLEQIVINTENYINSKSFKNRFPETGWDVKVIATRIGNKIHATVNIPFIAKLTPSYKDYSEKLKLAKKEVNDKITSEIQKTKKNYKLSSLHINAKDRGKFVYLTAFGTALDKGDYGAVGRGNKYSGIISINKESNIEAVAGKNPTNHSGKLYTMLANDLAWKIHKLISSNISINISAKIGDSLNKPHFIVIKCDKASLSKLDESRIKKIANDSLALIDQYYKKIINADVVENHISRSLIKINGSSS